jgi:hypothetical protein
MTLHQVQRLCRIKWAFVRRNEKGSEVATACEVLIAGSMKAISFWNVSEESCKSRPTFQKCVLPPWSGQKHFWNVGLPWDYTAPYPTSLSSLRATACLNLVCLSTAKGKLQDTDRKSISKLVMNMGSLDCLIIDRKIRFVFRILPRSTRYIYWQVKLVHK